ncbi:MAG: M50 family metallopeptidase [Magnetococcales bacterium]|nr:M50 family metallopeptidase [Magnetococcales bacterium]
MKIRLTMRQLPLANTAPEGYSEIYFAFLLLSFLILGLMTMPVTIYWERLAPYFATGGLFSIIYLKWLKSKIIFWETFFHELTHAFFAILLFRKISRFVVTHDQGGLVTYYGERNWLITLSPYFFPIHTIFLILLTVLNNDGERQSYFCHSVGVSYAWFLLATLRQFSFKQTDILHQGRIFSAIVVISSNILICLSVLLFLQGNLKDIFGLAGKLLIELYSLVVSTYFY